MESSSNNQSSQKNKDFFESMPSKTAFFLGMITAFLVLGTIGFFALGNYVLKGNGFASDNIAAAEKTTNPDTGTTTKTPTPAPAAEVPGVDKDDHIRGEENAPLTIIEYSDMECPFCNQFHETMKQVMTTYEGKVRWVYRHFPLSFHPQAKPTAVAAECAGEQGKFWEFADVMFANQDQLGDSFFKQTAKDLGLNTGNFDTCLTSGKYDAVIAQDQKEGSAAGVTGTPGSFFIDQNGTVQSIRGALPFSSVQALIDAALQK